MVVKEYIQYLYVNAVSEKLHYSFAGMIGLNIIDALHSVPDIIRIIGELIILGYTIHKLKKEKK